ncbi:DnaJ domain-containing protein [Marispirochaeta sp.]|jgi:hypothetical protein|uniref:J domain-containing protein n=1 Tax=Marispirochaeta sp. TaxID=2038653 RepID=UPI0029C92557|nr:DnaJ domain-containing protein [Marispirochaeta sp.]
MIQLKHLILLPILAATLLFIISGSILFGLIFALILGLMYADFLRRGLSSAKEEQEEQRIPPELQHISARDEDYLILGLNPEASLAEVRKVYKNLAAQFHPDTGKYLSDEQRRTSEEAFLRIREAHDRIMHSRTADQKKITY